MTKKVIYNYKHIGEPINNSRKQSKTQEKDLG